MDGAIKDIQGWVDYFDGMKLSGVVYGIGANDIGEIQNTTAPKEAYTRKRLI